MEKKFATTITTAVTHGGIFHADDVFSVAILKILIPEIKVERKFKVTEDDYREDTIVVDIGGGEFDHHQTDAELRADGNKHAAVGLLYRDVRNFLFPTSESADAFEKGFIIPIEDADNGVASNPLSIIISSMNPDWDSDESPDEAFDKAVEYAQNIVQREIDRALSEQKARDIVTTALSKADGDVVVLPQFAPWHSVLCPSDARFVIYPSIRGGFNLQVVPVEPDSFTAKKSLPKSWLETKPEGCTFVHPGRFIAAFDTQEHAIEAAHWVSKALPDDIFD